VEKNTHRNSEQALICPSLQAIETGIKIILSQKGRTYARTTHASGRWGGIGV
jgi:hypothetical protein